jgi:hypothetical protein
MKMESFFNGPADEDTSVQIQLSLKTLKFMHATLVECYDDESDGKSSGELSDTIIYLETIIKNALTEHNTQ